MSDTPLIGAKTTFAYSTTLGGSYTSLANMIGVTPGELDISKAVIECFDSPLTNAALPTTDSIPAWATQGPFGAKLLYLKGQYAAIRSMAGLPRYWKVIFPDGSGYAFPGYISKVGKEAPLKELMTCDITVEVTGGAAPFSQAQS